MSSHPDTVSLYFSHLQNTVRCTICFKVDDLLLESQMLGIGGGQHYVVCSIQTASSLLEGLQVQISQPWRGSQAMDTA